MSATPAISVLAFVLAVSTLPGCKSTTRNPPGPRPIAASGGAPEPIDSGATVGASRAPSALPGRLRGVLGALDADGDGVISAAEIANAPAALRKLDRNRDGRLTSDEVRRRRRARGPGRRGRSPLRARSFARGADQKKILATLAELDQKRIGMMNVPTADGRLLRLLVEAVGAKHVVEIGTSNGYSGIWISLGLLATGGKLTTYEIDPGRASLARKHFKQAGVDGRVTLILGDAHAEVKKLRGPIDVLFLDADKEGYVDYLEKLLPKMRPGGLILGHNMVRPTPDPRFIRAITTDPGLETLFVNMDGPGMSVSLKRR